MLDLVLNHTSDEHPWFKAARADRSSPFRDWYVWSDEEPPTAPRAWSSRACRRRPGPSTRRPARGTTTASTPSNPTSTSRTEAVRSEMKKVVTFWERLGVSGFRLDGAPFLIETTEPGGGDLPRDYDFLVELRERLSWLRGDAVFLAEAHVPSDELVEFFGDADGAANRVQMLFAFRLNEALMVALARQEGGRSRRPVHPAAAATKRVVGNLPAQPRRGRPVPAERGGAGRRVRGLRPRGRAPALRPRHPATPGTDDGRRPAPPADGLQPPVHDARHARAAVRRRDRHGRGPRPPRA